MNQYLSFIRSWKFLLPVLASILFFLLISFFFQPSTYFLIEKTAKIENNEMIMTALNVKGYTSNNEPYYSLTAAKATQNLYQKSIISLNDINAVFFLEEGRKITLMAKEGLLDRHKKTLKLPSPFTVQVSDGMMADFSSANICIRTGSLFTEQKVKVYGKNQFLTSDSMRIFNNGQRIIFKGNVKLFINHPSKTQTIDQNFLRKKR